MDNNKNFKSSTYTLKYSKLVYDLECQFSYLQLVFWIKINILYNLPLII